jgi:C1A family cysteine protease
VSSEDNYNQTAVKKDNTDSASDVKKEIEEKLKTNEKESTKKNLSKPQKKNAVSGQGKFGEDKPAWHAAVSMTQEWSRKYKDIDDMPDSIIPQSFDLRNINGYDFTGNVRDQSECGSCFTMAFIQTIEARLKYKYAHLGEKAAEPLSP